MPISIKDACNHVVGLDKEVPLLNGARRRYVNFDNAATTPPFVEVVNTVNEFLGWYSSVHRGTGYKSILSTKLYEQCRQIVADFVGADPDYHTVIFCHNTTDAINKLCQRHCLQTDEVILTTVMEHHSNLLPWRFCGKVDYVRINSLDGSLDLEHLKEKLVEHKGKVRLVALTGASNITGFMPPLKEIAILTHEHGAKILVDGAQLLAHRAIVMGRGDTPEHIDFLAFSAHKMYAPFGCGVLVGPKECFQDGKPAIVGGGAVELVTLKDVIWAEVPEKEEAGTPNLIGALALARAIQIFQEIGMENVATHDREMTRKTLELLKEIPGIRIFGASDSFLKRDRVGVIPILADKYDHALLAAILGYEWGIGVRHGCFCAHSYVTHLFELSEDDLEEYIKQIRTGDRSRLPGFVRISFGVYNTAEEIEYFSHALREILEKGPQFPYRLDKHEGEYIPEGLANHFSPDFLLTR